MSATEANSATANNDETVVVNMATYNRNYVKNCMDNGFSYAVTYKDFKGASEAYKRALENLKLYPEHKTASMKKSQKHEEKADSLFKEEKFEKSFKRYQEAIDALMVLTFSMWQCGLVVLCLALIPLVAFVGGGGKDTCQISDCNCRNKALPEEKPNQ